MSGEQPKIARWTGRLVAFLIDSLVYMPVALAIEFSLPTYNMDKIGPVEIIALLLPGLSFMAYLTAMEHITCTTVGRRAMRLRVIATDGGKPTIYGLLLSNFGKTFLLLIDVIAGLIFVKGTRQRIFASWGKVVVVKMPKPERSGKFTLD